MKSLLSVINGNKFVLILEHFHFIKDEIECHMYNISKLYIIGNLNYFALNTRHMHETYNDLECFVLLE